MSKLNRLHKKEFRDAYVRSHLTQGLPYQIRALRMQRGWSQQDLANKLGLKRQSAIARIEDPSYGKLSISTLLNLSSVFDVALNIKFVSFGKFLADKEDLSPKNLAAESFESELPKLMEDSEQNASYKNILIDEISKYESYEVYSNKEQKSTQNLYNITF